MRKFMIDMYMIFFKGDKNVLNVWNCTAHRALAQKEYCQINKAPHFAPMSGVCWNCRKNIYTKIDMIRASSELITGCPHCYRSYCE